MRQGKTTVGIIITACLMTACQTQVADRAGRLLAMAGEEATGISNTLDRFRRQLNMADTQLRTLRAADAIKTLQIARETLKSAKAGDFDDLHRIAGWTAIAQLSLRGDRESALAASDQALATLNSIEPVATRAQYVGSLAFVLEELRGNAAAIELLDSGGLWAMEIPDASLRRRALVAFAYRLSALDAFEDARTVLRRDPDAAWRTDELLSLANSFSQPLGSFAMVGRGGRGGGGGLEMAPSSVSDGAGFGKDVRFESVFQKTGSP